MDNFEYIEPITLPKPMIKKEVIESDKNLKKLIKKTTKRFEYLLFYDTEKLVKG